ncbi:hypothetical protein [Nocardioides bruguierae]|uniref:Amino acid transporter n=1 Tax=Nocardioides bruguierae TaxID=2945102 RepID=A0A9X2IEL1_9ACTN|nr:hypothetical protein [Nocardioides bruguierae]MCM0620946.1 hypothetical protein [Nocardioides bruguierae]
MGVNDLSDDAFTALYGDWAGRTPTDAVALMTGYPGTWWVAGGYAVEALTGPHRGHHDLDLAVLGDELPLFRRHVAGRLDCWSATSGALAPLLPDDRPDGTAAEVLPDGCVQLWTRPSARHPWEYDVLVGPGSAREWVYRRDERIRMPMAEALTSVDGVPYLRPEIQLLYKAPGRRPQDEADLRAALPLLGSTARAWLHETLSFLDPEHPWLAEI